MKFLMIALIIGIVIFLIMRPRLQKTNDKDIAQDLQPCVKCGTFVSKNEAILSNGQVFCSKNCLD